MAFEFERMRPEGALSRFVELVWFARGQISYAREWIAPTGATVAVLNLGDPIVHATTGLRASRLEAADGWLSGPHDRPSLNEPLGRTRCYGVVATPVGAMSVFALDPRALRGRVVALGAWAAGPAIRAELETLPPEAGLARLLERLADGLGREPERLVRVERALRALEHDPGVGVAKLARRLGVSHAHLDREFSRVVGLGPRRLAAILRVRRLLAGLDVFGEIDWGALAARHGWYDQSHLIRDFKRYTGATPSAYVAAQRAHFERDEVADAAGFVPLGPSRSRARAAGIKSIQDGPGDDR